MKQNNKEVRAASHAGSWYEGDTKCLDDQLNDWLKQAQVNIKNVNQIKAIIGPHAGFVYSAPTAAWAYKYLNASDDLKVFLLGPCHYQYMQGCGISSLKYYETPLGNIEIDTELISQLVQTGKFAQTSKKVEEEEHSLEMHLPFIQKMLGNKKFKLIPIMVGNIDYNTEQFYAKLLTQYFDQNNTLFVISSDFCHWGANFDYMYYKQEDGQIYESIEKLDKRGIEAIQSQNSKAFNSYLQETDNTICGRHPIGILLSIIEQSQLKQQIKTQFVKYAQSSQVKGKRDSSVSYAASITYI